MGRVNSKEELLSILKELREQEVGARDSYVKDISLFSDIHITSAIKSVKRDEDKHIQIIDDMIEFLG